MKNTEKVHLKLRTQKRVLSFITAVSMLGSFAVMIPQTTLSISATATEGLDCTRYTEDTSGNGWIWQKDADLINPGDQPKLTLYGVDISVNGGTAITVPHKTCIELVGENKVHSDARNAAVITCNGDTTVTGSGIMEVSGMIGLKSMGDFTMDGGYIKSDVDDYGFYSSSLSPVNFKMNGGYFESSAIILCNSFLQTGGYIKVSNTGTSSCIEYMDNDATGYSCVVEGGYLDLSSENAPAIKGNGARVKNTGGVIKAISTGDDAIKSDVLCSGGVIIAKGKDDKKAINGAIDYGDSSGEQLFDNTGASVAASGDTPASSDLSSVVIAKNAYSEAQSNISLDSTYINIDAANNTGYYLSSNKEIKGGNYVETSCNNDAVKISFDGQFECTNGATLVGIHNTPVTTWFSGIKNESSSPLPSNVQLIGISSGEGRGVVSSGGPVSNAIGISGTEGNFAVYTKGTNSDSRIIGVSPKGSGVYIDAEDVNVAGTITGYTGSGKYGIDIDSSSVTIYDAATNITGFGNWSGINFSGNASISGGTFGAFGELLGGIKSSSVNTNGMIVKSATGLSEEFSGTALTDKVVYISKSSTIVPSGKINYTDENITDLEPGKEYTVSMPAIGGTPVTVNVIASEDGKVPLSGNDKNATSYDFMGESITITPVAADGEEVGPQTIVVPSRPGTPDAPVVPVTTQYAKPDDIVTWDVETTADSIKVVNPVSGQEYSIDGGTT